MKNSFGTAKANMKNAIVRVVEGESTVPGECTPLGHLRHRVAAVSAERLARRADLHLQRKPSARGRGGGLRTAKPRLDRAQHRPVRKRDRDGHRRSLADPRRLTRLLSNLPLRSLTLFRIQSMSLPNPLPDNPTRWDGWKDYNSDESLRAAVPGLSGTTRRTSRSRITAGSCSSGGRKSCR